MKPKTALIKAQTQAEDIATEQVEQLHGEQSSTLFWQIVGGIKVGRRVSEALSAQTIRLLLQIKEQKLYLAAGCDRFDDFLDHHPESPMSHEQYRERVNLLKAEGDETFDILNSLRIPLSARKLLAEGAVRIEGDDIILGKHDEEQAVSINDRTRIVELIKTLANENARQSKKIEQQAEKIKKGSKELDAKKKELDRSTTYAQPPYEQALFNLIGAFTVLYKELEELPAHERKEKRNYTLKQIADQRLRLEELFSLKAPKLSDKERAAGLGEVIEELADEM